MKPSPNHISNSPTKSVNFYRGKHQIFMAFLSPPQFFYSVSHKVMVVPSVEVSYGVKICPVKEWKGYGCGGKFWFSLEISASSWQSYEGQRNYSIATGSLSQYGLESDPRETSRCFNVWDMYERK